MKKLNKEQKIKLLRVGIAITGMSNLVFARDVLGGHQQTLQHYLGGKRNIPDILVEIVMGVIQFDDLIKLRRARFKKTIKTI